MGLKITGSKPARRTRAPSEAIAPTRNAIARYTDRQADLAELPAGAIDVLTFFRLLALVFDARRHLAYTVERRRKLEAQLDDPALVEHPKRPQAERRLAQRHDAERLATIALAEHQAHLAAQWDAIDAEQKHRYGLYTLIGEPDPDRTIDITLWRDDKPVSLISPLPPDWSIPTGIAHLAYDPERQRFGVHEYTYEELFHSDAAGF